MNSRATAFTICILRDEYNEDAVVRLLQCLLKYKMMAEYVRVLQVLFNYKCKYFSHMFKGNIVGINLKRG